MDDYIRREAAKAQIRKAYTRIEDRVAINCVLNDVPAADVAPVKRGRWKYTPAYQGAKFGFYNCSSCGSPFWWNTSRYCPDCGAKMERGADDE